MVLGTGVYVTNWFSAVSHYFSAPDSTSSMEKTSLTRFQYIGWVVYGFGYSIYTRFAFTFNPRSFRSWTNFLKRTKSVEWKYASSTYKTTTTATATNNRSNKKHTDRKIFAFHTTIPTIICVYCLCVDIFMYVSLTRSYRVQCIDDFPFRGKFSLNKF